MSFDEAQTRYMLLLLDRARTSVKKRRLLLDTEIKTLRHGSLESQQHLRAKPESLDEAKLAEYYLDPLNQLVHIALSIARFQTEPLQLATEFRLPPSEIRAVIERLERLGVIEQRENRIRTLVKSVHLPRGSTIFRIWRDQVRLLSLERLSRRTRPDDYSFSATFSASERTRDRIKSDLLELLKRTEELVGDSKLDEVFQMNLELFAWTGLALNEDRPL